MVNFDHVGLSILHGCLDIGQQIFWTTYGPYYYYYYYANRVLASFVKI